MATKVLRSLSQAESRTRIAIADGGPAGWMPGSGQRLETERVPVWGIGVEAMPGCAMTLAEVILRTADDTGFVAPAAGLRMPFSGAPAHDGGGRPGWRDAAGPARGR